MYMTSQEKIVADISEVFSTIGLQPDYGKLVISSDELSDELVYATQDLSQQFDVAIEISTAEDHPPEAVETHPKQNPFLANGLLRSDRTVLQLTDSKEQKT